MARVISAVDRVLWQLSDLADSLNFAPNQEDLETVCDAMALPQMPISHLTLAQFVLYKRIESRDAVRALAEDAMYRVGHYSVSKWLTPCHRLATLALFGLPLDY